VDGHLAVLLGGINNARHAATLIALDVDHWSGPSVEENLDYQLVGMAPGNELRRLILPRSCMNQRFERYNAVLHLAANPEGLTVATIQRYLEKSEPVLYYQFDKSLRFQPRLRNLWVILVRVPREDKPCAAEHDAR